MNNALQELSDSNFKSHHHEINVRTDRMFAWVMAIQYVLAVVLAVATTPRTWSGASAQTHPHVWTAIFLGGALAAYPIFLAARFPGTANTRFTIAVSQALFSTLLIHLSGGRVETHFHIFGSLAFLAIYRDWRVLVVASAVVASDHFVRGFWFPSSIYGVASGAEWRFLEHAGWVILEDAFLIVACVTGVREMRSMAERQAELELANGRIERTSAEIRHALQASQALSSETSLGHLVARVREFLGAMTGADSVRVALWQEGWSLEGAEGGGITLADAVDRKLLPLTPFRHAERTMEPLLVEDVSHDERFSGDPYFSGRDENSLLFVPVLSKGEARAFFILESRRPGSFSADRLDAVQLIAGQFAVSVENAVLYDGLERRVQDRTQELQQTQAELVMTARRAGMAEIATNVLHNVGNVLNSINVSAGIVSQQVRKSKAQGLSKAVALLNEHEENLGDYLTQDPKGKQLPGYLAKLADSLGAEQRSMSEELEGLTRSIDHVKEIVSTQQSYAGVSTVAEPMRVRDLVEDALRMNSAALSRHEVNVVREFEDVPVWPLDKHRVLQILVNLIGNAKAAIDGVTNRPREITLKIGMKDANTLRIFVKDNGEGIPAENLTRIFSHGFTTRKEGHGFGLHSCIVAAKEMGGELTVVSDGVDKGAVFSLELPKVGPSIVE